MVPDMAVISAWGMYSVWCPLISGVCTGPPDLGLGRSIQLLAPSNHRESTKPGAPQSWPSGGVV